MTVNSTKSSANFNTISISSDSDAPPAKRKKSYIRRAWIAIRNIFSPPPVPLPGTLSTMLISPFNSKHKVNVLNHQVKFEPNIEQTRKIGDKFTQGFTQSMWDDLVETNSKHYAKAIKTAEEYLVWMQDWLEKDEMEWMNTFFEPFCKIWGGLETVFPKKFQETLLEVIISYNKIKDDKEKVKELMADPLWKKFKVLPDEAGGEIQTSAKYAKLRGKREEVANLLLQADLEAIEKLKPDDELKKVIAALVVVLAKQTGKKKAGELRHLLTDKNEQKVILKTIQQDIGVITHLVTGRVGELTEAFNFENAVDGLVEAGHDHLVMLDQFKKDLKRIRSLDGKIPEKKLNLADEDYYLKTFYRKRKDDPAPLHPAAMSPDARSKYFKALGESLLNILIPPAGHQMPSHFFETGEDGIIMFLEQALPSVLPEVRSLFLDYLSEVMNDDLFKTLKEFIKESPTKNVASEGLRKLVASKLALHLENFIDTFTDPESLKEIMATTILPSILEQFQRNLMKSKVYSNLGKYGRQFALLNDHKRKDEARQKLVSMFVDAFKGACHQFKAPRVKDEDQIKMAEDVIREYEEFLTDKARELKVDPAGLNSKLILKEWMEGPKGESKPIYGDLGFKLVFDYGKMKLPWWLPKWVVNLFKGTLSQKIATTMEPYRRNHISLLKSVNQVAQRKLDNFKNECIAKLQDNPVPPPAKLTAKQINQAYNEQVETVSRLMYDMVRSNTGKMLANQIFRKKAKSVEEVFGNIMSNFIPEDENIKKTDDVYTVYQDSNRNLAYKALDVLKESLEQAANEVTI